jgi:hypothetical protein
MPCLHCHPAIAAKREWVHQGMARIFLGVTCEYLLTSRLQSNEVAVDILWNGLHRPGPFQENFMKDKALTTTPIRANCKRRHDDGEVAPVTNSHEKPPQKRVRRGRANGIPKAARSAPRTRRKPVARIPNKK